MTIDMNNEMKINRQISNKDKTTYKINAI